MEVRPDWCITSSHKCDMGKLQSMGSTFEAALTLSRALMNSTRVLKGGAAVAMLRTYGTAAAPFTAPREMSAAKPGPAYMQMQRSEGKILHIQIGKAPGAFGHA